MCHTGCSAQADNTDIKSYIENNWRLKNLKKNCSGYHFVTEAKNHKNQFESLGYIGFKNLFENQ